MLQSWRLNLTGLSQTENLYALAVLDRIHIFEPDQPLQVLSKRPALILSPARTPSATSGFIDPDHPHAVNHLLIDFLGDLEILLVACDDGDVFGYYIRNIQTAIQRRIDGDGPNSILGEEVQPFLTHNVGASAWGLSVHTGARKIAISSNSHQVTVIAFGLAHPFALQADEVNSSHRRANDRSTVIANFHNNLPSITFCNTEDDPNGDILVSGEITGLIYMHNLALARPTGIMQVGHCRRNESRVGTICACHNRTVYPHSIWSLSFIDKRAFRKIQGYVPDQSDAHSGFDKHWNGSMMRFLVPNANGMCCHHDLFFSSLCLPVNPYEMLSLLTKWFVTQKSIS